MSNALKTSLSNAMKRHSQRPAPRRIVNAPARPARLSLSPIPAERAHDFSLFTSIATRFFREPERGGRRWAKHQRMKSRSGYHVAPGLHEAGGRRGGRAGPRFFEVFYGARKIQGLHDLSCDRLNHDWRSIEETGAALLYRQGDNGVVTVYLYPAKSDKLAPVEDAIILDRISETAVLTGQGLLERHWRAIRAYAEVTSLDGEPTIWERARIRYLRAFRPQIRSGRAHPPEVWRSGWTFSALAAASLFGAALWSAVSAAA